MKEESDLNIRTITETDATAFLELKHVLDRETTFMACEPDERQTSLEEQRTFIKSVLGSPGRTILLAEDHDQLVGFLAAVGDGYRRARRRANIIVGIRQSHIRRGIGKQLFEKIEKWAFENNIRRLELTVMTHNSGAVALYEKRGFKVEGTKIDSLFVDGNFVDEYAMAKLI